MVRDFVRGRPPYRARSGAGHRASARRRPTGRPDLRPASTPPLSRGPTRLTARLPPRHLYESPPPAQVTGTAGWAGACLPGMGPPGTVRLSREGMPFPDRSSPSLGHPESAPFPKRRGRPASAHSKRRIHPDEVGSRKVGPSPKRTAGWAGSSAVHGGQLTHAGEAVCSAPPGGVLGDDQDTRCPSGRGPAKPRPRYLASGDPRPPRSHALRGRVAPARLAPCRALSPYSPQSSARVRTGPGSR